jgi:hypothetical protein
MGWKENGACGASEHFDAKMIEQALATVEQ